MTSRRAKLMREFLEMCNDAKDSYSTLEEVFLFAQEQYVLEGDDVHIQEICRALKDVAARRQALLRTSLSALPEVMNENFLEHFWALSPEAQHEIQTGIKNSEARKADDPWADPKLRSEYLDRHFASEVVEMLDNVVDRATALTPIIAPRSAGAEIQAYFAEAHQAYLFGFPVACAVLCRAILECALRMKVQGRFDSFSERIEEAFALGELSQESRVWAYDVKEIGDKAIHNYQRFSRGDLSDKIQECIVKTRAIVQELLGDVADAS